MLVAFLLNYFYSCIDPNSLNVIFGNFILKEASEEMYIYIYTYLFIYLFIYMAPLG